MQSIVIERLVEYSDDTMKVLNNLISQLSPNKEGITEEYLREIINLPNVFLFVAKERQTIIGTFSLLIFQIPTGTKVSMEDVVIDTSMRGKKIGERMIAFAIDYATNKLGVKKIDLTSSPERIAANKLYQKLGFVKRDTNVYRFEV